MRISLFEPKKLQDSTYATNLTCNGFPNGTAKVVPSGGVNPYDYYWPQLDSIKNRVSGLDSGIFYVVQITDGNKCILYDSVKVGSPMVFQFKDTSSHYGQFNIQCNGINDGFISVTVSGGSPKSEGSPYDYTWKWLTGNSIINKNSSSVDSLYAGKYRVIAYDVAGCNDSLTLQLTQPDPLVVDTSTIPASCYHYGDGSVTLSVTGGTKPYKFNWYSSSDTLYRSNSDTLYTVDSLKAVSYSWKVTDANNCPSDSDKIKVLEPDPLKLKVDIIRQPYCPDSHDGIIDLTPLGGNNSDYAITWQPAVPLTDSIIFNGKANDSVFNYSNVSHDLYYIKIVTTRILEDHKQCILTDTLNVKGIRGSCISIPDAFFAVGSSLNVGERILTGK